MDEMFFVCKVYTHKEKDVENYHKKELIDPYFIYSLVI